MEVTVKLATREGAAHVSGILAGFILLARRGELTLRIQDEWQGSPIAREALLETEIDGRTVVFDLMDGYFYNDPAAVLALFRRADVVFKRSFSAEKNRQFPGDIPAKLRPLGLNYYVTCPGSPLEAERSAKSRLKQWALSTRCYPQDFEARLTRVRKKPRILFLTRLWDPEEPAVQQYPELQAEWRQVNADRIELLHRLQSAFPAHVTEPLRYTLPGGFEEGKNYKTYTSPAECEEQLRQLLADPAAILAMAQHNAAYYQTWLRPEQQVRQALRQLEAGKM